MEPVIGVQVPEDWCRFPGDERKGGNLALAQFVERHFLIIVDGRDRYLQQIEKPGRGDRGAGATQIDIDLLVGEVRHRFDVLASEEMELLVVELGDVGSPIFETREQILLPRIIEHVYLQYGHVDAAQQFEVRQVLQRPLADDRQNPPRRTIIDDIGEILGDAHRYAGGASRLELDDTPVDAGLWRGLRRSFGRCRGGVRESEGDNDRGRDDPALHWQLSSL